MATIMQKSIRHNETIKNPSLNALNYFMNKRIKSCLFLNIMIVTILYTISAYYDCNFFQNNKYGPIITSKSNYIQKNLTANIIECLYIGTRKAVELQYGTVNAALIIEGNLTQISKYFVLIKANIIEWYDKIAKVYFLTKIHKHETLSAMPQQFQLLLNKTVIISKHSFLKINTPPHDLLIWLNINNVFPVTHCNYSNVMNVKLGSNEWIQHKTMHIPINWIKYRLGDMIKSAHWRNRDSGYKYHKANFPHSIAVQYMEEIKSGKEIDLKLLSRIISKRKQFYPSNNTLVVHLRTGDVLDLPCSWRTGHEMMKMLYNPISMFDRLKSKFISHNLSKVVLITGFHVQGNHTNSVNYMIKIKQWFEHNNFSVSFRINENADEDFIFMCNSKFFIQSAGGFSKMIASVVKMRNGIVLNFQKRAGFMKNGPPAMQKCLKEFGTI